MAARKPKVVPNPSRILIGKLSYFEQRHRDFCFRGMKPPDEIGEIETDYEDARQGLIDYVASLEAKVKELESK